MEYFVTLFTRDKPEESKKGKKCEKRKMEFLKSQKRRRKSLDESLLNPIKSLMGKTRSPKRNTYVCDETALIQTYLSNGRNFRRGSDNEPSKKQFEDPFVHKLPAHTLKRNLSLNENVNVGKSVYEDITNLLKPEKSLTESDTSCMKVTDMNAMQERKQIFYPGDLTKTEKKCGNRRRKSENEFIRLIRESSYDKIRNAVRRSSSLKERYNVNRNEQKEEIRIISSVDRNSRFKSKHIRTKSASEMDHAQSHLKRSSSLLANPLLRDTTDTLYDKHMEKVLKRTRSASEFEPLKPDNTAKERLRNTVERSSSLKESRSSYLTDSAKACLKNTVKKSSSFKDAKEKHSNGTGVGYRAGSESDVFIASKSVRSRLKNAIKRSTSLKESKESLDKDTDDEVDGITRYPVKRSSSAKEKINKRILPSIVRRISRTKTRKDADTDESNNDDENTGSDFDISRYSPTSSHNGSDDKISIKSNHSPLTRVKNEVVHREEVIRRAVSRSNSLHRTLDRFNCAKGELIDDTDLESFHEAPPVNTNRSLSTGDALHKLENKPKAVTVHRQYSLREDRSNSLHNSLTSPMILHTSRERLDLPSTFDRNEWLNRSLHKKRKIFPAFRNHNRRRSVGPDDSPDAKRISKLDNIKLELLLNEILHEKMKSIDYDHRSSNERCRSLSTSIEACLKERIGHMQDYKIVAIVYIAETRDNGVNFASQCFHEPGQDLFATAIFQNDSMFVCTCVFASHLLPETLPQIIG